jgi:hypothetical protein
MTAKVDDAERLRALTDLDSCLLVEAAAGTGKTSLLAGRVVMLLAAGVEPKSIAAITSRPANCVSALRGISTAFSRATSPTSSSSVWRTDLRQLKEESCAPHPIGSMN